MPSDPSPATDRRSNREAMRRGLLGRCPRCGPGKLFAGYLRVVPTCSMCGEALGRYRAADGPAFVRLCQSDAA